MIIIASTFYFYMIIKINIKMNKELKNLHKICPVYIILLTIFIWRISDMIHFIKKFSEENNIIKDDMSPQDIPFQVRQETYNWYEKSVIVFLDMCAIMSYLMFIIIFSMTISYVVNSNGDKNPIVDEHRNTIIRTLSLIAFLMFLIGNSYRLGNIIITPLFYSVEKRFFNAPIKKFYYKLLYKSNKPTCLVEIKKLCSRDEKMDTRLTQDLRYKTNDLDGNEEDSILIKDKLNKY